MKAEKFARLNGIEWHELALSGETCSCGFPVIYYEGDSGMTMREGHTNDKLFTDAKSILKVMMIRENFIPFIARIGRCNHGKICMDIYYILNPDKLLDEAVKWCEENKI